MKFFVIPDLIGNRFWYSKTNTDSRLRENDKQSYVKFANISFSPCPKASNLLLTATMVSHFRICASRETIVFCKLADLNPLANKHKKGRRFVCRLLSFSFYVVFVVFCYGAPAEAFTYVCLPLGLDSSFCKNPKPNDSKCDEGEKICIIFKSGNRHSDSFCGYT